MAKFTIKPLYRYTLRGVLPRTNRTINLCNINKVEEFELLAPTYLKFFKKIFIHEITIYGRHANIVATKVNNNVNSVSRVVIPRIKRAKKKRLSGNVFSHRDENYFYLNARCFRKRVILKFDLEDEEKIMKVLKKSYYFRARYFRSYKRIYFIHNKYKLRTNSVYRYILDERIYNHIEHIDGNMFNYSKDNLRILNSKSPTPVEKKTVKFDNILVNKPIEQLIGFKRYSDRVGSKYVAFISINCREIKIGRFNDPYEAAMAYDIAAMYYKGPIHTKNYPYEYYVNLKPELVSKWNANFDKREINRKNKLARELL